MASPLRIAFVITELAVGGAERCLANLAAGLDRSRFEPAVYSLGPRPAAGRDQLVAQIEAAGVPTHFLGLTHWSQYLRGVRQLADLLQSPRPQIVQTFLFHANVLGTQAARKAGVRHVCTGIRVADPRWSRGAVERRVTAGVSRIICVSDGVAEQCRARGFDPKKLVVIPNGIDVDRWKNAQPADLTPFGLPAEKRALLFVGRLDEQKRLDDLLRLVPWSRLTTHDLLIVGDGPQRERLGALVKSLGIQSRVHFAGWQADVLGILAAADLLVLTSQWEGMPNVVLEAMAAGKPVLVTPVEGSRELLGDAFEEQTATDRYADRLMEVISNPLVLRDLGRRNQLRAEQEFSLGRMISRYSEVYQSLKSNAR